MTRDEAKQEATKRWGDIGGVFDREEDLHRLLKEHGLDKDQDYVARRLEQSQSSIWRVGRYWVGMEQFRNPHIYGNGKSWEEAFAAATKMQEQENRRASL